MADQATYSFLARLAPIAVALCVFFCMPAQAAGATAPANPQPNVDRILQELPIYFESNEGQVRSDARFLNRGLVHTLLLKRNSAGLLIRTARESDRKSSSGPARLDLRLVDAEKDGAVAGEGLRENRVHYLKSRDPADSQRNVSTYDRVRMPGVYQGIDWVFHGTMGALEFDFEVAPGGDPSEIAFAIDGSKRIELDEKGQLVAYLRGESEERSVRLQAPIVYQPAVEADSSGKSEPVARQIVAAAFRIDADEGLVRFEIGEYDRRRLLVIDPVISMSTHLGASGLGYAVAMDRDDQGALYIAGDTNSPGFPTTAGALQEECGDAGFQQPGCFPPSGFYPSPPYPLGYSGSSAPGFDAFVTKIRQTSPPTIEWSTYLGGVEEERVTDVVVDDTGRVHLVGSTRSREFPTTPDAFDDALLGLGPSGFSYNSDGFYSVISADGSTLEYSSLIGGDGNEKIGAIALTPGGDAVVAGPGDNFPLVTGFTEKAFVAKFDEDDSLVWTYFDFVKTSCFGGVEPTGLAIRDDGGIYLVGETTCGGLYAGANTPQPNCASCASIEPDAFLWRLRANGTRAYATYLGGSEADGATDVVLTQDDDPVVVGWTLSSDFPTLNEIQAFGGGICTIGSDPCSDGFVTSYYDESGVPPVVLMSTFVGGSDNDVILGADAGGIPFDKFAGAFDSAWTHDFYITGMTRSLDYPLAGEFQSNCVPGTGGCDETAFVSVVRQESVPIFSHLPPFDIVGYDLVESMPFSSYLGGGTIPGNGGDNYGSDVLLSESGFFYVAGETGSDAFPLVDAIPGSAAASNGGVFVTRLTPLPEPSGVAIWLVSLTGIAIAADLRSRRRR